MKRCQSCEQQNPEDARYCSRCGATLAETPRSEEAGTEARSQESRLWRAFIGPNADRYLKQFRRFTHADRPQFAFSWHWPAFLFDPFLWFLYRKIYLYAFIYFVGPAISVFMTKDFMVGIVWRIIAGASAHYIYFWHVQAQLTEIQREAHDPAAQERLLRDRGGVQPYVIWLGVVLHLLMVWVLMGMLSGGDDSGPGGRSLPFLQRSTF
jgi:zinc ribbon protein